MFVVELSVTVSNASRLILKPALSVLLDISLMELSVVNAQQNALLA